MTVELFYTDTKQQNTNWLELLNKSNNSGNSHGTIYFKSSYKNTRTPLQPN